MSRLQVERIHDTVNTLSGVRSVCGYSSTAPCLLPAGVEFCVVFVFVLSRSFSVLVFEVITKC